MFLKNRILLGGGIVAGLVLPGMGYADATLVADMADNGLNVIFREQSNTSFDWGLDNHRRKTAWIGKGNAFLAADFNANGTVDGVMELFSNIRAEHPLDDLARLDANGDGTLDALDPMWSSLRLWTDADRDGVCREGELQTMAQAGIVSISLAAEHDGRLLGEVRVSRRAILHLQDGGRRSLYEVRL